MLTKGIFIQYHPCPNAKLENIIINGNQGLSWKFPALTQPKETSQVAQHSQNVCPNQYCKTVPGATRANPQEKRKLESFD